jgi:hypothetical protein
MDETDIYDKLSNVSAQSVSDLKSIRNQALDNAYNKLVSELQAHYTTLENVGGDVAHTSSAGLTLVGAVKGFYESTKKAIEKRKARTQQQEDEEEEEAPEQEPIDDEEVVEANQEFRPDEAEEGLADDEEDFQPATLDDLDLDDYGARGPPPSMEDDRFFGGKDEIFPDEPEEADLDEFNPLDFDLQNPSVQGGNYSDIMGSDIGEKPLFTSDFETATEGEFAEGGRNFDSASELDRVIAEQDLEDDSDFNVLPRNVDLDTDIEAFGEGDVNDLVMDIQEGTADSRLAQMNLARGARPYAPFDENVDENLPQFRMGEEFGRQYTIKGGETELTEFKQRAPETETEAEDITDQLDQDVEPIQEGEQALEQDVGLGDIAEEGGEALEQDVGLGELGEEIGEGIGGEAVDLGAEGIAEGIAGVASQGLDWVPVVGQIVGAVGLIGAVAGGIGEAVNAGNEFAKKLDTAQQQLQIEKQQPLDIGGRFSVPILSSVNQFR